ncbi:hypothetical protein BJV82DRAFT_194595 [Fennellomyces sp. T-0311]|nr:hypothetical protein BJV82DRAFT_194595 [Fennellomyces sp. T-0311]
MSMSMEMISQFNSSHPFDSTEVDMFGLHHSTKATEGTLASSVREPMWHQPIKQEQSFAFLPPEFYPNPYNAGLSLSMHRRSLPDTSCPGYPVRQRRYTEGVLPTQPEPSRQPPSEDDEQRRKNFLERNRQAALKCRQRKKQWLANLQHQVEFLNTDNKQLEAEVTALREEILNLKTLIIAHKDCPVARKINGPYTGFGSTAHGRSHEDHSHMSPPVISSPSRGNRVVQQL